MKYLILQYPYDYIEIALCNKGKILSRITESKLHSVSLTIPHIESILQNENSSLQELSFIAVNTGPGPYNTLRSLITTANGIHFATKTPLISLDAFNLMLHHVDSPTLAILNAFANHVFYAFSTPTNKEQGYCSIEKIIHKINQHESLTLIGNGVKTYQSTLLQKAKNIVIPEDYPQFNSLEALATAAYTAYREKQISPSYLMPKYLQSPAIKK